MINEKGIVAHSIMNLHKYFTFYKLLFWSKLQSRKHIQKVDSHKHKIVRGAFHKLAIIIGNVS